MRIDVEHSDITHAHKTGYPRSQWRDMHVQVDPGVVTVDYNLRDYYGDIYDADYDNYVVTHEGYIVLDRNLKTYLTEVGYVFNYDI